MFALKTNRSLIPTGLLTAFLFAGCAVHVQQDFDPAADFVAFRTFYVVEEPRTAPDDPRLDTPFAATRIRSAIEAALVERGFRRTSPDRADFLVGYHFDLDEQVSVTSSGSGFGHGGFGRGRRFGKGHRRGFGGGFGHGFGHGGSNVRVVNESTLVIDIADREEKLLAWRGWGSTSVGSRPSPKKLNEAVKELVPKILEQFPPSPEDAYAEN